MRFVQVLNKRILGLHFHVHLHFSPGSFALVAPALSEGLSDSDRHTTTTTLSATNIAPISATVAPTYHVVGRHY